MTNQASEDRIEQHLLNDKAFQHMLKFAPESQRELMTFELARYINAIIRTEKLKLLAEVRERVIGENETATITDPDNPFYGEPYESTMADKNELRAELNKLEAEL